MLQQEMLARLQALCEADERLVAATLYGSFTQDEGDAHSDIECALFFRDEALEGVDPVAWIESIAPVALYFVNEFGVGTALFENLVRGEFHFERASEIAQVDTWAGSSWFPCLGDAILVDHSGELTQRLGALEEAPRRDTGENARDLVSRTLNWMLFGTNVLERGEYARALELLWWVQRHLLWMARLCESATAHWPTPSRLLENDLSPDAYRRYAECTATLSPSDLWRAYRAAWTWGQELIAHLVQRHGLDMPDVLLRGLSERLGKKP